MSSGLIYAAIVAMWALVLVPMWLRRHDTATETKSVDRFSTAMRILSRRNATSGDKRYLVMPRRAERVSSFTTAGAPLAGPHRMRRLPSTAPVAGRARLLARRRRVLAGLGGLAALTLLLAAAGALSWWWQLVVDIAAAAYLMHLRAEAVRARELASRRRRRARTARPSPVAAPAAFATTEPAMPAMPAMPAAAAPAELHEPGEAGAHTAYTANAADTAGWEPVPVPLPTYVTAPVAARRVVDWSSERLLDDIADVTADVLPEDEDTYLDELVERRRAVND